MNGKNNILMLVFCVLAFAVHAQQDTIRYTGSTLVNVDYHHGHLSPAVGVHNIQVMRASREHPDSINGFGWTYNHAPMLTYWNNTYYLEYLSNPVGEHVPPGQTLLMTSTNGYQWSAPAIVFPPYKIPDGTSKEKYNVVAKDLYAVMHQRMGFYISKSGRLLALAYYGIALDAKDDPNDGNGIGRVVREIYKNGKWGPIYFIRYNHAFNASNTSYPFFESSKDKGFVAACRELMGKPLLLQQWNEEQDRNDPLIVLKGDYKAFNAYMLPDGRTVALWKHALTTISKDTGKSWMYMPTRAPGFVNSNAKIWGQRTSDNKYITVYNPSEFRWPLALSVSDDGLHYKNLLLVNGEIARMRYGGNYKSYGPQYVRGLEAGAQSPDGHCWVTYSMNKEDIWVSKIPVPVTAAVTQDVGEVFSQMPDGKELAQWNIYSPLWAPVRIEKQEGNRSLVLRDADPFDYAKAERIVPAATKMSAAFTVTALQNNQGLLNIEFQDAKGTPGIRLAFDSTGYIRVKAGYRYRNLMKYDPGQEYTIEVALNVQARMYQVTINGKNSGNNILFAPLESVQRIAFRTGEVRRFPDADTPTDQMYDLPHTGDKAPEAVYLIRSLNTKRL
jgi:hypothetical protein